MFLSWVGPRSRDREIEPPLDLPVGVLGEADRAGLGDALQPRGDIDAVAHQIAVRLLDDVAQMNADAELDAAIVRHAGVALDHAVLHLDRAAHRVDDAAKFDEAAVAGALDDAPAMRGDGRINQIAAQRPEPRQRSLLVRAGEPAVADDIGDQDRSDLPRFRHGAASGFGDAIMNDASALLHGASRGPSIAWNAQIFTVFMLVSALSNRSRETRRSCRKMQPKQLKTLRRAQNCTP